MLLMTVFGREAVISAGTERMAVYRASVFKSVLSGLFNSVGIAPSSRTVLKRAATHLPSIIFLTFTIASNWTLSKI